MRESSSARADLRLERLSKHFGEAEAVKRIDLLVHGGEFMTLLGPSGCGKTTTIRMIAGYVAPSSGRVFVGDADVTHLPPQKRQMGMVFQEYALFPHLTVRENVAFGLRMRRMPRSKRRARADELLDLVGLSGQGDRHPAELSGGMRQRVALARSLAIEPQVMLLDEPFSALDAKLRADIRTEVRQIQQRTGVTTLLVTHDQQEALGVSDRIVVMNRGCVEQVGTPEEVYVHPSSLFVLDFVGRSTKLEGQVVGKPAAGRVGVRIARTTVVAADPGGCPHGSRRVVAVRPETVRVSSSGTAHGENSFPGVVETVEFQGGVRHVTIRVDDLDARILSDVSATDVAIDMCKGESVVISFDPDSVALLDPDGITTPDEGWPKAVDPAEPDARHANA